MVGGRLNSVAADERKRAVFQSAIRKRQSEIECAGGGYEASSASRIFVSCACFSAQSRSRVW